VLETLIKQAVKWIDEKRLDNPKADRMWLIDEASRRFDRLRVPAAPPRPARVVLTAGSRRA
jgi:hypothetical protein